MTSDKIRRKFINFYEKHKHKAVESSSLWPQDDPSVLLTTAGMQQFKPYFMGTKDPSKDFGIKRLISVQRCFRTSDIELVGDATHNTFFEMLGNFSIGDYFKKDAIDLAWQFLTKILHINNERLWATYYEGDKGVPKDIESIKLWKKHLPTERIKGFYKKENWWGPPGKSGPCGPCSEIHYDFTNKPCKKEKNCKPNCECGRFMELWNLVFMEYHMSEQGKLKELPAKNIDTGLGLERLALVLQKKKNIFETDLFEDIVQSIYKDKNFGSINKLEDNLRCRIVADHIKGSIFLLADGITFSNKEQGYILRRIFRRALDQYMYTKFELAPLIDKIINNYKSQYPYLTKRKKLIISQINRELDSYKKVLNVDIEEAVNKITNLKEQSKKMTRKGPSSRQLTADEAFKLYSTYGLSPERLKRKGFVFDEKKFNEEIIKHQRLSRAGAREKFGGHGLTSTEWTKEERQKIVCLHTATHLLHQALRDVLGSHVKQQGSDINPERLRFDFEHTLKLSDNQKKEIEDIVNKKIKNSLPVSKIEMDYKKAIKSGALAFFKEKYPERVAIYSIGDYSKEFCSGPHVENTNEIGKFRIISEKSSSSGIRRIKAVID